MTQPEIDFKYTDDQWAAISRELRRIGFDEDLQTHFDTDLYGKPKGVRQVLEFQAGCHLEVWPGPKIDSAVAKRAVANSRRLRKAWQELGWAELRLKDEDDTTVSDVLKKLEEALTYWAEEPPFKDPDPYKFVLSILRTYAAVCAKVSPKLPRYAVGNENGPTIAFLLAASRPVLGNRTPTKEAMRVWLRRNSRSNPFVIEDREGKPAIDEAVRAYLRRFETDVD